MSKIKNISLTPTWNLSHASPKGPECRLCPALLFEGLFSRCDLSSVNGHSEVAVRSFSKSCESSVPRCQEEHVIRTQSRGKTLVPPSGLTTQEGKLFVRWFTPCCYTEGSKLVQTSLKSKSFEVPKVRHLKVIFFFESVFDRTVFKCWKVMHLQRWHFSCQHVNTPLRQSLSIPTRCWAWSLPGKRHRLWKGLSNFSS